MFLPLLRHLSVLLEQLLGLLGGRHFFDPVGEIPLVLEMLEGVLSSFLPRLFSFFSFFVGYDREVVTAKAED